jgi:hypothetical protein
VPILVRSQIVPSPVTNSLFFGHFLQTNVMVVVILASSPVRVRNGVILHFGFNVEEGETLAKSHSRIDDGENLNYSIASIVPEGRKVLQRTGRFGKGNVWNWVPDFMVEVDSKRG